MKNFFRRKWKTIVTVGVVASLLLVLSPISLNVDSPPRDISSPTSEIGQYWVTLTIGTEVYAAGTADYTCDGTDDNVQFQAALDALPAGGGKLVVLAGDYNWANLTTVSRAINNVTIQGVSQASSFTGDGTTPIFSTGVQSNWTFSDLKFDAGGITYLTSTNYTLRNIAIGVTYYAYRTDATADEWEIPTGRAATLVIAASNSSDSSKAQADYVCDGTNDQVEIQVAINALPAGGGRVVLMEGQFNTSAYIHITKSNVILEGQGANSLIHMDFDGQGVSLDGVTDCLVTKLKVDVESVQANQIGIYLTETDGCQVTHCVVDGVGYDGILVATDYKGAVITHNVVRNCGDDGLNVIAAAADATPREGTILADNYVEGCTNTGIHISIHSKKTVCSNNFIYNCDTGIDFHDAEEATVVGNIISACVKGIYTVAATCLYLVIANNLILDTSGGHAIYISHGANYSIIEGNLIRGTTGAFQGIVVGMSRSVIRNNVVKDTGGHGISLIGVNNNTVSGNKIENAGTRGINLDNAHNNTIEGNTLSVGSSTEDAIYLTASTGNSIVGNVITATGRRGIYILGNSDYNIIADNDFVFDSGWQGLNLVPGSHNIITGNRIDSGTGAGIVEASTSDYNIIKNNVITTSATPITIVGTHSIAYEQHSDLFMDVLAASANYIVNAQNLTNGAVVLTGTQPKYPRGLDCTITNVGGAVSDYTMTVVGTKANGNTVTDVFTFADDGLAFSSDNAFDNVASVTLADVVDTGNATFVMGIDTRLGIMNVIYVTSDVWKILKNGAKQAVAGAQVDVDYNIYDMSVIGLAATDDFEIWYRSNLNIIN